MAVNYGRELAWLVEFGQIDFGNYRAKTVKKWEEDFESKMVKFQTEWPLNYDPLIRPLEFDDTKAQATVVVDRIKDAIKSGEAYDVVDANISLSMNIRYEGGRFKATSGSGRLIQNAVGILFYHFLQHAEPGRWGWCKLKTCGNLYYHFTDQKKKYCSKRCATLAGNQVRK